MKILVVDDKVIHRESAAETLPNHELTIVSSFDEAIDLLEEKVDEKKMQNILAERGFSEKRQPGWKTYCEIKANCIIPLPFDAVLTDMMMPMSARKLATGVYNSNEQVPYGLIIALKAASLGVTYVAMVTDTNHHKGAMSAALDNIGSAYYPYSRMDIFNINGAKVIFVHAPFLRQGDGGKDWGQVLNDLTSF